jgi:thioredoxin-related protein
MKKLMVSLVVIAITLVAFSPQYAGLPIGSSMPKGNVKMKDVSGKLVALNDVKTDNGLLVMFSCNTCPYVVKNQGRTRELFEYLRSKQIGGIILNANEGSRDNDDSYKAMQNYANAQAYKWYYVVDSNNELADAFGANRTPECYLFNKDGILIYHGAIDDNPADDSKVTRSHLKEAINEMLDGKNVSVKESRSVGCGIKRKS